MCEQYKKIALPAMLVGVALTALTLIFRKSDFWNGLHSYRSLSVHLSTVPIRKKACGAPILPAF